MNAQGKVPSTEQLTRWRHELHRIPELAHREQRTAEWSANLLRSLGLEVVTGVGGTGVVATLRRDGSTRADGLRAELDALPITEQTGLAYSSEHPGAMHACGHDGHLTMVLGAAAALAADPRLEGIVHIVLQPAEEPGQGAAAMIADGMFERFGMDAIFGLHNIPGLRAGDLATRSGAIMAGEDNFTITVTGRGGHASAPHLVVDPLVTGAQIVTALQSVVSRRVDPSTPAVLSCTDLSTDGARNAIPTTVRISGDTRNFDHTVSALLEARIREIAEHTARAQGATAEVVYTREFATTCNDAAATEVALAAARRTVGADRQHSEVTPIMASEDFGVYAEHVPANFTLIGNGVAPGPGGVPLHSHDYRFNDEIIPVGVDYYRQVVHQVLAAW